ncbi:MAG: hypothetical protein KA165_11700 [Saprospiraceae bacterium]|nr:hypothetical protein [Saprospiraceae bacterium]
MKKNLPVIDRYSEAKARYKKELADVMGYSLRTFQRRLKEANIDTPRGLICPDKQDEIFRKLGWHQVA